MDPETAHPGPAHGQLFARSGDRTTAHLLQAKGQLDRTGILGHPQDAEVPQTAQLSSRRGGKGRMRAYRDEDHRGHLQGQP